MRRWKCTYLMEGANGHKIMNVAALDMVQAITILQRELSTESVLYPHGADTRSLVYLSIEEIA